MSYREIWKLHSTAYPLPTLDDSKKKSESLVNDKKLPALSEREKVETAYNMLEWSRGDESQDQKSKDEKQDWDKEFLKDKQKIISDTFFKEFYYFVGNSSKPDKSVINQISRTKTKIGYVCLAKKLTELSKDPTILKKEQDIVKTLIENDSLQNDLFNLLEEFSKIEPTLQLLYDIQSQALSLQITADLFFKIFSEKINKKLNKDKYAFMIINMLNLGIESLSSFILPVESIRFNYIPYMNNALRSFNLFITNGSIDSFRNYAMDTFNLMSLFVEHPGSIFKGFKYIKNELEKIKIIINFIDNQIANIVKTVDLICKIYNLVKDNPILYNNIKSLQNIVKFFQYPSKEFIEFTKLISSKSVLDGFKVATLFGGKNLAAYSLLFELKKQLLPCLQAIADLDMYNSNALLFKEHQSNKNKICFVKFIDYDKPFVSGEAVWNIFLDPNRAIANDINIGANARAKGYNIILTGPNESGKSTFQKTILINLVYAQTFGMAFANEFNIRLFDKIKFYQNIQDDIISGKSLFRAQAEQFNKLFTNDPTEITFISSDEPATGANARICAAIAFNASKELLNAPNCTCILSTHFPLLTSLEQYTKGYFKNYKFDVIRNSDGKISYPYKMVEGISDQHVELDVFQKEGLKKSILEGARKMLSDGEDIKLLKSKL